MTSREIRNPARDRAEAALDIVDAGMQRSSEPAAPLGADGACWRCQVNQALPGSSAGVCGPCREILLADTHEAPVAGAEGLIGSGDGPGGDGDAFLADMRQMIDQVVAERLEDPLVALERAQQIMAQHGLPPDPTWLAPHFAMLCMGMKVARLVEGREAQGLRAMGLDEWGHRIGCACAASASRRRRMRARAEARAVLRIGRRAWKARRAIRGSRPRIIAVDETTELTEAERRAVAGLLGGPQARFVLVAIRPERPPSSSPP